MPPEEFAKSRTQDLAPDVYETPELTDDASTLPVRLEASPRFQNHLLILDETSATVRSESPVEDGNDNIDRHRINPDEARTHFLSPSERDPTNVTWISNKRQSYRSSSRRQRRDGQIVNGAGNLSDEDEENNRESLFRKLARLQREVAEVKGEFASRQAADDAAKAEQEKDETEEDRKKREKQEKYKWDQDKEDRDEGAQEAEALSEILESISAAGQSGQHRQGEKGAASRLTARLLTPRIPSSLQQQQEAPHHSSPPPPTQSQEAQTATSSIAPPASTNYTLTYAPTYNPSHTLAKITSFDKRLALLESALGIDALPLLPSSSSPSSSSSITTTLPKPLLPTLDKLDAQLSTLTTTTATSLETLGRQIRHLTTEAKNLDAARKAAAASASSNNDPNSTTGSNSDNPAAGNGTESKHETIQALHGTLPTILTLSPLLAPMLDRLRSLRALHADAASASQRLEAVEAAQETMRSETRAWTEALAVVERKVVEAEQRGKGNLEVVEGWVRDVEGRVGQLGV